MQLQSLHIIGPELNFNKKAIIFRVFIIWKYLADWLMSIRKYFFVEFVVYIFEKTK